MASMDVEDDGMDNICLPDELLKTTPSRKDGISEEQEREYRSFACQLVQEAGILLRLNQDAMATGQNIVQRFFYRTSLREYDAHQVAMGALFLASKVEETLRRTKDVINVFYSLKLRRLGRPLRVLDTSGSLFMRWQRALLGTEAAILKELGFCLYSLMEHPHKYILYFVKLLRGSQDLAQRAWSYLNDSLRLDLCVRHRPETIACAAIYLAARSTSFPLPDSPPWHALMCPRSSKAELEGIAARVLRMYADLDHSGKWLPSLRHSD